MATTLSTTDLTKMLADLAETRDWLRRQAETAVYLTPGLAKVFKHRADAVDAAIAFIEKTTE